ncbi:rhodanese-like domain-containing protein [Methanothrix sp.]|uniref:sulfurtransferase n=1 Tax=Methanothrix sp. TaxID=90426 RepID=UPI0032977FE5
MSKARPILITMGVLCGTLLAALILMESASAGAECASLGGACDDSSGGWDPMAKLNEIGNVTATQQSAGANWPKKSREIRWGMNSSQGVEDEKGEENESEELKELQINMTRSLKAREMLLPLDEVDDADILLDVSENSSHHIEGSIYIPYMEFFLQPGILKPADEVASILGEAGISREDSVVIYGECLPCGGGPSVATYVYWMMKSLGHENAVVLDGTAEDWATAGGATSGSAAMLPRKEYIPLMNSNYTATFDLVKSGQVQIIDARTPPEFAMGTIAGSISMPYESVLADKKITGEDRLDMVFMVLNKNQPVVVFTNTGMKGSVVWFALEMMGYDARLYSYQDWMANQLPDLQEVDGSGRLNETAI